MKVFKTTGGTKYHLDPECRVLKKEPVEKDLADLAGHYDECKICNGTASTAPKGDEFDRLDKILEAMD